MAPSSPYALASPATQDLHRLSRPFSTPVPVLGRSRRGSNLPLPSSGPSHENAPAPIPPLPTRPCEVCKVTTVTFFCVLCDGSFCNNCWDKERPHQKGKLGPDGFPHEKADPRVVNRLKSTFTPPTDPAVQRSLHIEDEDTAWFGIERDGADLPIFFDYGRFATLMANSATGQFLTRYPQLVSFIGQTGAGKSTIIKMLIEQQASKSGDPHSQLFPRPIVGSARNDNTPTSGDVHLYADPATYLESLPLLYADCEGLDGGEAIPISNRHKEHDPSHSASSKKKVDPEADERRRLKKRWKIARGTQRDIAWATSPETQKRQYAVTELYPRLLYTFSDVIVFVLQKAQYITPSYRT
jgi:energy-coupling factor transporter ATP-binding protein EcfA2